ncbi:hypothetical protein RIF29_15023 [Crotalaria pallida]|uniref:Uncharacterized protein n=1 Tax=Crotalaria pallida TaxID=3830 RepID=A0AAN9IEA4_CROPI
MKKEEIVCAKQPEAVIDANELKQGDEGETVTHESEQEAVILPKEIWVEVQQKKKNNDVGLDKGDTCQKKHAVIIHLKEKQKIGKDYTIEKQENVQIFQHVELG